MGTANNFKNTPAFFYGSMWLPLALGTVWLVWLASHLPIFEYLMSSSIAANFNFHTKVYAKD